jgi:hypothetical protein
MITFQFLLTALVVVLAPGTGVIYTLALGLGQGQRAAFWAALGCTFGIVPHLAAATFGLAAILHTSAVLFTAIKIAGVCYLLYLAWQSLQTDGALSVSQTQTRDGAWRIAKRGALINILNPKLSIFVRKCGHRHSRNDTIGSRLHGPHIRGVFALRLFCRRGAHVAVGVGACHALAQPVFCRDLCCAGGPPCP